MLIDTYGRVATDLRVSLTDRCNLRCTYCMPEEGLQWLAKPDLLTDDEIVRLIDIAVTDLGIDGGPLHRRRAAAAPRPRRHRRAGAPRWSPAPRCPSPPTASASSAPPPPCKAAGLDRVNVSLDTLRPDVFKTLTRRDRHQDVLDGLEAARDAGLTPVKVNSVLMPGLNDDEAPDLLAWAVEHDYELRFIEQMPLDAQHGWKRDGMITAGDILDLAAHPLRPHRRGRPASAAPPPPSAGSWTAARTASASSPPSPARSARPATAPGSPPTARCAPASSPARRPTCAAALRSDAPDEEIARIWRARDVGQEGGLRPGRPVVPPARPPDVGDRRLTPDPARGRSGSHSASVTTSLRKPRTPRN